MITTGMTYSEIIGEFNKDYPELRKRFYNFIKANRKEIKSKMSKTGNQWIQIKEPRKAEIRNNIYWTNLKASFKKDVPGFISITYMVLNDWSTGKKIALQFPNATKKHIIWYLPSFINSYKEIFGIQGSFKEAVDKFMASGWKMIFNKSDIENDLGVNGSIYFGSGIFGFGFLDDKEENFTMKQMITKDDLLKEALEMDLPDKEDYDPLLIYSEYDKYKKNKTRISDEDFLELKYLEEKERQEKELEEIYAKYN